MIAMETTQQLAALDALSRAATALKQGELDAKRFVQTVADSSELIAVLPPAFERVMADIVTRLEASALFGGESCSFSHNELYHALDHWLERARVRLEAN
jgi:hypothetical protein